jgi:hypothetical protein
MKPNFKEMSKEELIAYVKKHRTDSEAVRELFFNRRSPDETATWYPAPLDEESIRIGEEAIRQKIQEIESKRSASEGS